VSETTASASAPQATEAPAKTKGEVSIKLFARTDVGQVREHNEDNFLVADLTKRVRGLQEENRVVAVGKNGNILAVRDGMGGAAAGEVASQLAVDIIYEKMTEDVSPETQVTRNEIARRLVRAVEAAGLRIFEAAKSDRTRRGMGTTVTAAALVDDHLFLAQVGDSRGYLLRDGNLVQVTRDQSLVNQLIEAGQLTEEEAETFEHNNIILQALGTAETVQVDLTFAELRRGDMIMLCSDGLSGMVRNDEIREVLKAAADPLEACKALTDRANAAGGHDNITVIVAQFDGEGLQAVPSGGEPMKYRKYALPEEPTDPARKAVPATANAAPSDGVTSPAASGAATATATWSPEEERIEIPGTHVPAGIVVALILAVIALLAGTAFLLLR
jgi:protein phosphatase